MNNNIKPKNYTIPKKGIRDRYKAESEYLTGVTQVNILRDDHYDMSADDATYENMMTERWLEVGSYTRNHHGLMKTFEPFQQFHDNQWKDYALISPDYETVEVMDLESGLIVAVDTEGTGFCPVDFYVPDWWDFFDESYQNAKSEERYLHRFINMSGTFGFYSGCHWGDDTSWKVQHIDLSRLHEGIVSTDNRFGYVELPDNLDLKQAVVYDPAQDNITINVPITFGREGKAKHKNYLDSGINWESS